MKKTMFYASDLCGPCGAVKDALEKHPDLAKLVTVVRTDSKAGDLKATKAKIDVVPTFVRPDGKRLEGFPGVPKLRKFLEGK